MLLSSFEAGSDGGNLSKVTRKLSEKVTSEQNMKKSQFLRLCWGEHFRPRDSSAEAVIRATVMPTFRVCHSHVVLCYQCPLETWQTCHEAGAFWEEQGGQGG